MGRVYQGLWKVQITYDDRGKEKTAFSTSQRYEDCEKECALYGAGLDYEGFRVTKTKIIRHIDGFYRIKD